LVSEQKDFQVIDFSANMPIDVRIRQWSMRVMPYHISSHLGDDYIKRNGVTPQKYTFDSFKWLGPMSHGTGCDFTAASTSIIRSEYTDLGRYAVQNGFEWTSRPFGRGMRSGIGRPIFKPGTHQLESDGQHTIRRTHRASS